MSTLRVSNIEAKSDASSPSVNEKVKVTNSNGDVLVHVNGETSGITTIGINTTGESVSFDSNQNATFVGIVTATEFVGNVTGDVTANQITVGDTFLKPNSIAIGNTNTAGRNAGVSTATGEIIFNTTTGQAQVWNGSNWKNLNDAAGGITATGGAVNDYTDGSTIYRSHTFLGSGTFSVDSVGSLGGTIDYLLVGAGGANNMGSGGGTGGGAGALIYKEGVTVSDTNYSVVIGAGQGGVNSRMTSGGNSTFETDTGTITAYGGGGGGANPHPSGAGGDGGSGGGGNNVNGSKPGAAGGTALGSSGHPGGIDVASPPSGWGNPGGTASGGTANNNGLGGGGGGGAAATGGAATYGPGEAGDGGDGARYTIRDGTAVYYAGGGGGGNRGGNTPGTGGQGGGGAGTNTGAGNAGEQNTGGGAGGGRSTPGVSGGSGICVVRYRITANQQASAKATGGSITNVNGKIIHTFTSSGTFARTDSTLVTADILVVGGGGGGGSRHGGGGGAGAVIYKTSESIGGSPYTITVGAGGDGLYAAPTGLASKGSNTTAFGYTAEGGGYGTSNGPAPGGPGGSGGGSRGNQPGPQTGGTASGGSGGVNNAVSPPSGWGNIGGIGDPNGATADGGGGGGGAGLAGGNGGDDLGGAGGNGLAFDISGSTVYYGGGGGGAPAPIGDPGTIAGAAGLGGGGVGGGAPAAEHPGLPQYEILSRMNGQAATGGGGGAGGSTGPGEYMYPLYPGSGITGGRGGSGIVIISYPS